MDNVDRETTRKYGFVFTLQAFASRPSYSRIKHSEMRILLV